MAEKIDLVRLFDLGVGSIRHSLESGELTVARADVCRCQGILQKIQQKGLKPKTSMEDFQNLVYDANPLVQEFREALEHPKTWIGDIMMEVSQAVIRNDAAGLIKQLYNLDVRVSELHTALAYMYCRMSRAEVQSLRDRCQKK